MDRTAPSLSTAVAELAGELAGNLITSDDAEYDAARQLFYTGFDRSPAAVVRAAGADDVQRAVRFARETGIQLAVRSGGHSIAGHGVVDGGITLDLSQLRSLDIDATERTAWAGPGLTAGDFTTEAGEHGLATGFGDYPSVGIGGITLGGGMGFLSRKYGLTIDSLLAAEIVTADGALLRTDAATEPDLFWALRGGGGNFGVVTRFKYRLHQVRTIVGGMLVLPATPDVLAAFAAQAEAAPDELSAIANVMVAPPLPFLPDEHHGKPILMAIVVHAGAPEDGERAVAPFRALHAPLLDGISAMSYPEIYSLGEGPPPPAGVAVRSLFVDVIDHAWAQAALDHLHASEAPMAGVQIRVLGGAVARVPSDATAFAHRQRRVAVNVVAGFNAPGEAALHDAWAEEGATLLRRGDRGAYVGFVGDDDGSMLSDVYPPATLSRLIEVKRRYDPDNLFRANHNIAP